MAMAAVGNALYPIVGLLETLLVPSYGLLLGAVLALCVVCCRSRRRRRLGEPPLINGWIPFFGVALNFLRDTPHFLQTMKQKHGDIFTIHVAGAYMTFISDPLQHVSLTKNSKYLDFLGLADRLSSKAFDFPSTLLPEYQNMPEVIHRSYQLLQGKSLEVLLDNAMKNMQHAFKRRFSQATDWETAKLKKFCFSLMFETTFTTLYGKDPFCYNIDEIMLDRFLMFDAKFSYIAANIPIELLGETKRIRKELICCLLPKDLARRLEVSEIIQARMNMLEMYNTLRDYDKGAHHFAFLWASVANTLPIAFWAMYYLLRHPEAVAVVRNEIDHLLQSTGQERRPGYSIHLTREQLDSLPYLESAVNETLRMFSSSVILRLAKEDLILKLDGDQEYSIRKGDVVAVYPPLLHMDPEVYEDPKKYKFDRYIENGKKKTDFYKEGKKLKQCLLPFGCGVSICPGRYFAQYEIKMFITFLLANFDTEILEDKVVEPNKSRMLFGIVSPSSDIFFRYKLRS